MGVEEQFYLLWPLALLLIFLLVRRRRSLLVCAIGVIALSSLIAGAVLTAADQPTAFFSLHTRAWELLIGAVVGAMLLKGGPRLPAPVCAAGGWLGIAMILASAVVFDSATAFPGVVALLPTLGTALVILFGEGSALGGPTALLSVRPMQFIGLISYSLYLVHWPLLVIPQAAVGEENPLPLLWRAALGIGLALPLAWLLFRFVETPLRAPVFLRARRPRATLIPALGVSLVLVLAASTVVHWSSVRELGTSTPVAVAPETPREPPTATEFVPQNLRPALDEVAEDLPRLFTDGCHLDVKSEEVQDCTYGDSQRGGRIALFGDSHSAQWFPAVEELAQRSSAAISAYTKSSCTAAAVTVLVKGAPYAACDRWREKVTQRLIADPPDLIVISSYAHYALAGASTEQAGLSMWRVGLRSTVQRLRDAGSEVLIIADTPRLPAQPPTCLSANVDDVSGCDVARGWAIDDGVADVERTVAGETGAAFADLTPFICAEDVCPVIIDDIQVYRDVNHLTSTFVSYLAPALTPQLSLLLGRGGGSAQ